MRLNRIKLLIICALALALAPLSIMLMLRCAHGYMPNFGTFHDDGIYTVCAKSLAERHDYRIISLPMEPLETKYPPLFPMLLGTAFVIQPRFPANIPILEAVACLAGLAAVFWAGALLVVTRRATILLALVVVAASWLNLNLLSFLPIPMSDLMFAAVAAAAIMACERAAQLERRHPAGMIRRRLAAWAAVSIALVAASLTHVMGAFLTLSCLSYLLVLGLYFPAAFVAAIWLLTIGSAWVWAGTHAATAPAVLVYYTNYLLAAKTASAHLGGPISLIMSNLSDAFTGVIDRLAPALQDLQMTHHQHRLATIISYGSVWACLLAGLVRELKSPGARKLLSIWIVAHSLVNLMWPKFAGERHLLVVMPFLYYYFGAGIMYFGRRLKQLSGDATSGWRPPRLLGLTFSTSVLMLAAVAISNAQNSLRLSGFYGNRVPPPAAAGSNYSEATEFQESYRWIREHTRPEDVLVWNNDPAAYLFTGRHAIMSCMGENWRMIASPGKYITAADLLESIRLGQGNYLAIDPIFVGGLEGFDQLGAAVSEIMKAHPGSLAPVFTSRYGLITIFHIDRTRLPP